MGVAVDEGRGHQTPLKIMARMTGESCRKICFRPHPFDTAITDRNSAVLDKAIAAGLRQGDEPCVGKKGRTVKFHLGFP